MATWQDLANYIRAHYKVAEEGPGMMKLIFDTGELRSQIVMVWRVTLDDGAEEWLQIESPFAELGTVDLGRALQEVGQIVCGALAIVGNVLTIRHAAPLENLNINEFERPLGLVTNTADRLEHILSGGDQF
jgi:hypothetical protein